MVKLWVDRSIQFIKLDVVVFCGRDVPTDNFAGFSLLNPNPTKKHLNREIGITWSCQSWLPNGRKNWPFGYHL